MFDKGMTEAFMSLLGQNIAQPVEKELVIRCSFKGTLYSGISSVDLPYRYTSFTNARTAKSVFRSLGEDVLTVIRDAGGQLSDEQRHTVTFEICKARS
jgi:hypothetical protein